MSGKENGKLVVSEALLPLLRKVQRDEVTDQAIYTRLAKRTKGTNREVLLRIAGEERLHGEVWGKYSGEDIAPNTLKVSFYLLLSWIFGITFVVHLLERDEVATQEIYRGLEEHIPEAKWIREQEELHERELIAMIDEERLRYVGSMVLGLNDALVELTGALAGFTLALGDARTIGLAGFITGSAATLSMAASEFLSKKTEGGDSHPLKAAVYTGVAYMITVVILLLPYFIFSNPMTALLFCLLGAAAIILTFTFFVSVVREEPLWPSFLTMIAISFGVALVTFFIGWAARTWLGVAD